MQTTTPFKTAHAIAVDAIAIVVEHKPKKRAWPFLVTVVDFRGDVLAVVAAGVAQATERSEGGSATAAVSSIPCGNYGDNLTTGNGGCL